MRDRMIGPKLGVRCAAMSKPAPLPPRPQAPKGYDCCGGGCADCELTAYVRALAQWKQLKAEHEKQQSETSQ